MAKQLPISVVTLAPPRPLCRPIRDPTRTRSLARINKQYRGMRWRDRRNLYPCRLRVTRCAIIHRLLASRVLSATRLPLPTGRSGKECSMNDRRSTCLGKPHGTPPLLIWYTMAAVTPKPYGPLPAPFSSFFDAFREPRTFPPPAVGRPHSRSRLCQLARG